MNQVAWVAGDLDATEAALGPQFGVTAWTRLPDIRFGPETCTFRGKPADFTAHVSLAYSGDLQLELIQPVSGESLYSEHLTAHGPGLHHTCFEVTDMAAAVAAATAAGIEVVQAGSMAGGGMQFAYLDASSAGASYVELAWIRDDMRAFFEALKSG
jgi:4-hydroxyphenylpyruvate dioxygenase-like putative hemolysin